MHNMERRRILHVKWQKLPRYEVLRIYVRDIHERQKKNEAHKWRILIII